MLIRIQLMNNNWLSFVVFYSWVLILWKFTFYVRLNQNALVSLLLYKTSEGSLKMRLYVIGLLREIPKLKLCFRYMSNDFTRTLTLVLHNLLKKLLKWHIKSSNDNIYFLNACGFASLAFKPQSTAYKRFILMAYGMKRRERIL